VSWFVLLCVRWLAFKKLKEKNMQELVVYPNNTVCVDGRLLTQAESAELLKKHGIHDVRLAIDLKFRRGDTTFTIFTAPGLKMLDELSTAVEELKSVGRKHENALKSIRKKLKIKPSKKQADDA